MELNKHLDEYACNGLRAMDSESNGSTLTDSQSTCGLPPDTSDVKYDNVLCDLGEPKSDQELVCCDAKPDCCGSNCMVETMGIVPLQPKVTMRPVQQTADSLTQNQTSSLEMLTACGADGYVLAEMVFQLAECWNLQAVKVVLFLFGADSP